MATLIGINLGYLLITFLPPIAWLLFYLREDENPEPKRLILITFLGGIFIAIPAAAAQYYAIRLTGIPLHTLTQQYPFGVFFFVAFVEEFAKFLVVQKLVTIRPEFDEPIDAMIYMMSAAMGFAAIENALFAFPVLRIGFFDGLGLVAGRFLGANLLHVLASGVLGFFLAKAYISVHRKILIIWGIFTATVLHTLFNYLIIIKGGISESLVYLAIFLAVMALIIFAQFERLKADKVNIPQV